MPAWWLAEDIETGLARRGRAFFFGCSTGVSRARATAWAGGAVGSGCRSAVQGQACALPRQCGGSAFCRTWPGRSGGSMSTPAQSPTRPYRFPRARSRPHWGLSKTLAPDRPGPVRAPWVCPMGLPVSRREAAGAALRRRLIASFFGPATSIFGQRPYFKRRSVASPGKPISATGRRALPRGVWRIGLSRRRERRKGGWEPSDRRRWPRRRSFSGRVGVRRRVMVGRADRRSRLRGRCDALGHRSLRWGSGMPLRFGPQGLARGVLALGFGPGFRFWVSVLGFGSGACGVRPGGCRSGMVLV